jgi:hypothetical protein
VASVCPPESDVVVAEVVESCAKAGQSSRRLAAALLPNKKQPDPIVCHQSSVDDDRPSVSMPEKQREKKRLP